MPMPKRIVLVAGEASGDLYAAQLVEKLRPQIPGCSFSGAGGALMAKAGVDIIIPLAKEGIVGFTEVVRRYPMLRKSFYQLIEHIQQQKPDLVILIDYPGFNLRLAKQLKPLGHKLLYYISPQLWAWKPNRIHIIQQCIDTMAVIFPFEKSLYQRANVPVYFVGHPLNDCMQPLSTDKITLKNQIGLSATDRLIALLPGSRDGEIKRLLPVMIEAAEMLHRRHPNTRFILPLAPTVSDELVYPLLSQSKLAIETVKNQTRTAMSICHVAMVASGTASLECALFSCPMVVLYKTSSITYTLGMKLIQIKYISLVNIILNQLAVPELIQQDCTAENTAIEVEKLLVNDTLQQTTQKAFNSLQQQLNNQSSDCTLQELVLNCL